MLANTIPPTNNNTPFVKKSWEIRNNNKKPLVPSSN
jgi:hypothetical protein